MSEFSSITRDRLKELADLISIEENLPVFTLETLFDAFLAVYSDCKAATNHTEQISGFLSKYQPIASRLEAARINTKDFDIVKTLATGAVGRVCLVKSKKNNQVYAMKILKKHDLLTRQEASFFMEERNVLVFSQKSEWITTLYASFQDEENLYLVMEYVSGASFRALINTRETIMEEHEAKFYIAEMILALAELHNHKYIHRDVKPENYLLDATGHIKLADFGSCIRLVGKKVSSQITVGTPDYISPEILRANEGSAEYGQEVDWWSLGIILYELLCDEVPFYAESLVGTYGKIMNHEETFQFPDDIALTDDCKDLISRLICKPEKRLGCNGVDEIKKHPWFKGIDWNNIRKETAPFIPELSGPDDTRYFEDEETEMKKVVKKPLPKTKEFSGNSLAFIGYGYLRNATATILYPEMENSDALVNKIGTPKHIHHSRQQSSKLDEAKAKLEASLASLTLEKTKMESERDQLKLNLVQVTAVKEILSGDLENLKKQTADNVVYSNMVTELKEIKKKLESEVETLNSDLRNQKEESIKTQMALKDMAKAKSSLESKIKGSEELIATFQSEKEMNLSELSNKNASLLQKDQEFSEASAKLSNLTAELEKVTSEFKVKTEQLQSKSLVIEDQSKRIQSLEKDLAIMKLEGEMLDKKFQDLQTENNRLTLELREQRNSSSTTDNSQLESLLAQIEAADKIKERLSNELAEVSKAKATLEVEFQQAAANNSTLQQNNENSLLSIKDAQERLQTIQSELSLEREEKSKLVSSINKLESEIATSRNMIAGLQASVSDLEILITERENLYETLDAKYRESLAKLNFETEMAKNLTEKLKIVQDEIEIERKLRIATEAERGKTSHILKTAQQKIESISEYHKTEVSMLKSTVNELERQLYSEMNVKNEMLENQNLTASELDLAVSSKKDLEGQITELTAELLEAKRELSRSSAKIGDLQEHIKDLEKQNDILKTKIQAESETAPIIRSNSNAGSYRDGETRKAFGIQPLRDENRAGSIKNIASKAQEKFKAGGNRLSGMFFKSKDNLTDSPEKLKSPEPATPITDDFHRRKFSRQSSLSLDLLFSPITKIPTTYTLLDFFNPMDGLSGLVKVPKDGKVKKGWKSLFLAFSNDQLKYYNSQDDFLNHEHRGIVVCDISCEIFVARSVTQSELIHAKGKDIDKIFKIQAYTPNQSTLTSEQLAEKEKRIANLKNSIELEERMITATQKILDVTSETQKVVVIGQLDASNKRLRTFKNELERLSKTESLIGESEINQETLRKEFEEQLKDEIVKRDSLNSLAVADRKKYKNSEQAKQIEIELLTCERMIAKLKENLDILDSRSESKKEELIQSIRDSSKTTMGHAFIQRQYFKPTDCSICAEPLWDTKNVGIECSSCKIICHKECGDHLDVSCSSQGMLKNIPPMYFMAVDMQDRSRWLAGLQYYRKNLETVEATTSLHRLKSYVEPVNRMSMSPIRK